MADIRHSIQIAAQAEAIYPLVATGKGFSRWWVMDTTQSGDAVDLGFFNRSTIYRLRLKDAAPPSRAEWECETGEEWKGTRIAFQLEPTESGTLLRFSHSGWRLQSEYFISCNTTWGELMFRLKAAAEGNESGPLFRTADMAI